VLELERLQTGGETAEIRRDATKKLTRMTVRRNQVHNHWIVLSKLSDLTAPGTSLVPMAEYEQAMATGRESLDEAFKPSTPKLIQRLSQPGITALDAARLVALYQVRGKKLEAELDKICDGPRIDPKHRQAIRNLATLLGPMYNRKSEDLLVPKINGQAPFKADKYLPLVYQLVNNALDGKLDGKAYEVPSHSGRYQNIVVFVVGGISYMELRWLDAIRTRLKGTKLYVGSTCPLIPRAFLAQVAALTGQ
jgi:hypothetical protein